MTDYFGYDIHFVMNITDIDDKVYPVVFTSFADTHNRLEIILRARQNYLFERFRSETKILSPELISQVQVAWSSFVQSKLSKGLPVADLPQAGLEESHWPSIVTLASDREWKKECLKRDEKFDMYFSAAVRVN
jgi:cysteinyl-tRNA synthetase